jgi:ribosome-associated protein
MTKILLDAKAISDIAVKGLQEIKGQNIVRMNLTGASGAVTDYFIICTGTSDRHVSSLAESVLKEMKAHGERPISTEGLQHGEWVLIDFVNVVIHIFQKEKRDFYRLEALWGDAEIESFADPA